jgi:hypothetical protein
MHKLQCLSYERSESSNTPNLIVLFAECHLMKGGNVDRATGLCSYGLYKSYMNYFFYI